MKRILIMGLPGAGKTFLANHLVTHISRIAWFNADEVREKFNDWDFSYEGRLRQAIRMRELADNNESNLVICDFVAPLPEMRDIFDPHILIWVDTIKEGQFDDTNNMFVPPEKYDIRITDYNIKKWVDEIIKLL